MDYISQIKESIEELLDLEKQQSKSKLIDRIRFIRYLKTGLVKAQATAGELIGIQRRQSCTLWKLYRQQGMAGLLGHHSKGTLGKLNDQQISELREYILAHPDATLRRIQKFLSDHFKANYTKGGVAALCKRIKVKHKPLNWVVLQKKV